MRQFYIFTLKEFYHIFRDRWTTLMILALPVLMILLFGFGISTEIKNAKFAVYDPSHDEASQGIVDRLMASEYFAFEGYLQHPEQIEQLFRERKIGLAVVMGENLHENLVHSGRAQVQLIADGTDPNTASTIASYATNIIALYQLELMEIEEIPFHIHTEIQLLYNPTMKGAYSTVPGVMGMVLMLICAMMTSISIAREIELGTMEVLLVSPLKPLLLILSKVVPYFVLSMVNLTTILLLSVYVVNVPINGSIPLLVFVSIVYVLVCLSLGLLISTSVETQLVALLMSAMGLLLPAVMLSGLMFPIESMPWPLQAAAQIVPAKWYIVAVKNVMIKGLGFSGIVKELAVMSFMAFFLIGLSVKRFKIRLE